ncbi:hypothetical protein [Natronorubrum halophilum]|uniref:hypothetical protein n=1 Tax=Natronorubrum halophilum TaxID=1702106 RepID=UPI000EF749DA|nr:hypothetical protein [Natronorubrum halophilum]
MNGPGILWMLQTAVGFSMAGPMFFLGLESLRTGRYTWAVGYLTLGALVLYFPTYLVNRIGGPRAWIRRRLPRRRSNSDASASAATDAEETANADAVLGTGSETATESDSDAEPASDSTDGRTSRFDRFRR